MPKTITIITFLSFLLVFCAFLFMHITSTEAARVTGNCILTNVGVPSDDFPIPDECADLPRNTICHPVDKQYSNGIAGEYCKLPPEYDRGANQRDVFYKENGQNIYLKRYQGDYNQDWGSKELISVLYKVAKQWKHYYPTGYLIIMDINSNYHDHHIWGLSVDVTGTTNGADCVASFSDDWRCHGPYNAEATVELGKLFIDTGYFLTILHNGQTRPVTVTDPTTGVTRESFVNKEIYLYAQMRYPNKFNFPYKPNMNRTEGPGVIVVDGHEDHFHLYIDRDQANYAATSDFYQTWDKSKLKDCTTIHEEDNCN